MTPSWPSSGASSCRTPTRGPMSRSFPPSAPGLPPLGGLVRRGREEWGTRATRAAILRLGPFPQLAAIDVETLHGYLTALHQPRNAHCGFGGVPEGFRQNAPFAALPASRTWLQ